MSNYGLRGRPWSGRKTAWEPAARSSISRASRRINFPRARGIAIYLLNLINFQSVIDKGVSTRLPCYIKVGNDAARNTRISLKSDRGSPTNRPTWKLTATRSPRNFFPTSDVTMRNWGHSLRCVGTAANKISEVNQIGKETIRSPIPALTRDILINERHDCSWLLNYHTSICNTFPIRKIINNRMRRVKMSREELSQPVPTKFLCIKCIIYYL